MSVNGLSGVNFYELADNYVNSRASRCSTVSNKSSLLNMQQTQTDTYVSEEGNTCTDGKDDGKVGFFSAICNVFKGAVKSIGNGLKGMFFDENGNFSLLKTAKTAAMAAACIAFPAVGLVACGIGAVSGGVKLVKGVSTALGAKTDAEAKDAWEAVGDGGLTVAVSVLGAKASLKGIKSGATKLNGKSAIDTLKSSTKYQDASTLSKVGQYAKALGKDMLSSTKHSAKQISFKIKSHFAQKEAAAEMAEAGKGLDTNSLLKSSVEEKIADGQINSLADAIQETGLSEAQLKQMPEVWNQIPGVEKVAVKQSTGLLSRAKAKLTNNGTSQGAESARASLKNAKTGLSEAQKALKTAQKSGNQESIQAAQTALKEAQAGVKAAKSNVGFGKLTSKVKTTLSKTETSKYLKNNYTKLTEGGLKNIVKNIKANKNSVKISKVFENLSKDGQNVIKFLQKEEGSYYEAVEKFGYENVLEALETFAGYRLTDKTV